MSALILIADSDPFGLRLLSELCSSLGYEVVSSADGSEVLDTVARVSPVLLIMDTHLPEVDGFEVLRILKADDELSLIPVLLATAEDDVEGRQKGLELGAEDYITKPYRTFEIQQRIKTALRLHAAQSLASRASLRTGRPDGVDSLSYTGTASQLHISLDYEFTRAVRYGHALSCIIIQLGNYIEIHKTIGADSAENVLVILANALWSCIRGVDQMFRSHQYEFTILLPETNAEGAQVVVERIRKRVDDRTLFGLEVLPNPVITIGCASYPDRSGIQDGEQLPDVARGNMS